MLGINKRSVKRFNEIFVCCVMFGILILVLLFGDVK